MTENKENKTENKKPATPVIPKAKPNFGGANAFKPKFSKPPMPKIRKSLSGKS